MGEVYRARDARLDRSVAIKILPAAFSTDSDRLHRFEQEARSASALNHPNIVTIYALGLDASTHYIAMELVEGKTLRELLASGLLPIRKAIEIAAQVAEGLAKAHEAGITPQGLKAREPDGLTRWRRQNPRLWPGELAPPNGELSDMSTTLARPDPTGPWFWERWNTCHRSRASGHRLDFRSDQFSFGSVLYEMVTGKRAFQRSTAAETLVAILREQPELIGGQNPDVPAPLCWVIERCLTKEVDKRYASTRDLARNLQPYATASGRSPLSRWKPGRPIFLCSGRGLWGGRRK